MAQPSAFLEPGPTTAAGSLAIVQLSRDSLMPVLLQDPTKAADDGYAEGAVLNTRFGSFPHSTLIGVPWGSQIRASTVDTGSRGRKRKRPEGESNGSTPAALDDPDSASTPGPIKKAVTASSGFVHILMPTPELWTQSLPHRTQVVYTPDYSYVLQRLRARPGLRLIEAGAGSGSFTHASVRAVYNGYPKNAQDQRGKVYSFEFNEERYEKMQEEIKDHHLEGLVQLTHRDAYTGGFLVDGKSPEAEAVFLDLPCPWDALPHLSRSKPAGKEFEEKFKDVTEWVSPLNPKKTAYLCTFSPCIEQVQRSISVMRRLGWVDIDMVEIAHKRINVARERPINQGPPEKKAPPEPYTVGESVARLREIERRARVHNAKHFGHSLAEADQDPSDDVVDLDKGVDTSKPWKHGRVTHRAEGEIKSHTSYLVFATLPREWSDEEEAAALAKWPCGKETSVVGKLDKETRKREKRELLATKQSKRHKRQRTVTGTDTPMTEASSTA